MWEPLHEFTFDADALDVFVHILGPERQRPRRIVLTNHAYWFVCEFRPTTIALLREMIEERRLRAQEGREQGAEASKPGKARHDDTTAIRALLEAWVEQQTKEHAPARASRLPLSGDADTRHLRQQLVESHSRYETLSKRIAALDKDLGRMLDSKHKLTLQERRRDLVTERDQVAKEMARIEQQLGS